MYSDVVPSSTQGFASGLPNSAGFSGEINRFNVADFPFANSAGSMRFAATLPFPDVRSDEPRAASRSIAKQVPGSLIGTGKRQRLTRMANPGAWNDKQLENTGWTSSRRQRGSAQNRALAIEPAAALGTIRMGQQQAIVVNESNGAAQIRIQRIDDTSGTATVDYVTVNGTARAGADYRATTGTVTFKPGDKAKIVSIPIFEDSLGEEAETFSVSISGVTGANLSAPRTALVRIVDNDPAVNDLSVNLPNFSNVSSLVLNGNAVQSGTNLQLTAAQASRRGSVFSRQGMAITDETSFQTQFQFQIDGGQGTRGSNGFTFMLHNSSAGANALGFGGGSLGYGNISNSLAIEFDTFKNTWDANSNSISILQNGNVETPIATAPVSLDLNSGQAINAWVDYDGATNGLQVFLSDTAAKPTVPVLSTTVDLLQVLGSTAFAGFSAATGGTYVNNHNLLSWQFSSITGPPKIGFGQSVFTALEDSGSATVTLKRSGSASGSAAVDLITSSGSATSESDFTPVATRVTFAPGELSKTVAIPITVDTAVERNEIVQLQLSNPTGGTLSTSQAALRIQDDDAGSFATDTLVTGLAFPTAFDWTSDGQMLISQKNGIVRVFKNGQLQSTPFIDISAQVNAVNDRGLLSIAAHPNFAANPYVYLLFTYDPPQVYQNTGLAGPDGEGNRPSRLIRVRATTNAAGDMVAVPGSEAVLLGKNSIWDYTSRPDGNSTFDFTIPPSGIVNGTTITAPASQIDGNGNIRDYLATDSSTHSIGTIRFGKDGSLFVSNGDGASFGRADYRGLRVQDLNNLSGKLLRIDPITGQGLTDNPFYNGDPNSNRSKVYSYGFRNPFRFAIHPTSGEPFIGDVGWSSWEEINTGRGLNFGWPFYEGGSEGNIQTPAYSELPEAQAFYSSGSPVQAPIYAIPHSENGAALIAGDFYTGSTYPSIYSNTLFFTNIRTDQVYALFQDEVGYSAKVFATGTNFATQIRMGQDSNMYFNDYVGGKIFRWRSV